MTGTMDDRPVANDDGSFSIDVRSDEDLARRPVVYFVMMTATEILDSDGEETGEYEKYRIADDADAVEEANALTQQEDENHWAKTYKVNTNDFENFPDGLVGVIVTGYDDNNDNTGSTAGWGTPGSHRSEDVDTACLTTVTALDLKKMHDAGLIVEIDNELADAKRTSS